MRRRKTLFGWLLALMLIGFLPLIVLTEGIVFFSLSVIGIADNLSYLCMSGCRDFRTQFDDKEALTAALVSGESSAETEKMQARLRQYAVEEVIGLNGEEPGSQIRAVFILVSDGAGGYVYGGGYWESEDRMAEPHMPAELPRKMTAELDAFDGEGCLLFDWETGERILDTDNMTCTLLYGSEDPLKAYYCIIPERSSFRILNIESVKEFAKLEIILLLVMLALLLVALFFLLRGKVLKPLSAIERAAGKFEENCRRNPDPGNWIFERPKKISANEIGRLSDSISKMAGQMKADMTALLSETREREKRKAELDMAASIQKGSLPSVFPPYPDREDVAVFASMTPAREVGGDFYDFGLLDEDHLWFAVGDVSDKGMPAALFMMMAKTALHNLSAGSCSPAEILERANRALFENNPSGMFVTIWIGILDLREGLLTCANGGHTTPVIRRADGTVEDIQDRHDFLVGCRPNRTYHEYVHRLGDGDTVFVFSDGVTEARAENGELFGQERMEKALKDAADPSPEGLTGAVQDGISLFAGWTEQADDITMIAVRWTAAKDTSPAEKAGGSSNVPAEEGRTELQRK